MTQKNSKGRGSSKRGRSKPSEKTEQAPVNGILVRLTPGDEEGSRQITVQELGDVKRTEIPTLLRIAAKNVEGQFGIE